MTRSGAGTECLNLQGFVDLRRTSVAPPTSGRVGKGIQLEPQLERSPEVIVITPRDPSSSCRGGPVVSCLRYTGLMLVAKHPHTSVFPSAENGLSVISGSIVHDYYFEVAVGICEFLLAEVVK